MVKLVLAAAFVVSAAAGLVVTSWPAPMAEAAPAAVAADVAFGAPPAAKGKPAIAQQVGLNCYLLGGSMPVSAPGNTIGFVNGYRVECLLYQSQAGGDTTVPVPMMSRSWTAHVTVTGGGAVWTGFATNGAQLTLSGFAARNEPLTALQPAPHSPAGRVQFEVR